jgi:hypothetical protein
MTDFQILNSEEHKDLCCDSRYLPDYGYSYGAIMLLPSEIPEAQREYAILFRKHTETGNLYPNVLLGLKEQENLFLDGEGGWNARYVPLSAAKGPFMITMQEDAESKESNPVICADVEDKRFSGEGERLFDGDGKPTVYLNKLTQCMYKLHRGAGDLAKMVSLFTKLELIEPLRLDIKLNSGEDISFGGGYTIPEEKLNTLTGEALAELQASGYMGYAHFISASLNNIQRLIDIKNAE